MQSKTILKIIFIFLFLSFLSFLQIYLGLNSNEGLEMPANAFVLSPSNAFCKTKSGTSLETSCNSLTPGNCNSTSCCVMTSNNKCKSGNINGPIFNTNAAGKTNPLNYYYFQGKCYGSNCPSSV